MADIKISDLSIGDWVEIDGAAKKVWYLSKQDEINDTTNDYWVKPIPLTPEILEKNGFEKNQSTNDDIKYTLHIKQGKLRYRLYYSLSENNHHRAKKLKHQITHFSIDEYTTGNWICIKRNQGEHLYLHQLQHALRLAGVEKEIEV